MPRPSLLSGIIRQSSNQQKSQQQHESFPFGKLKKKHPQFDLDSKFGIKQQQVIMHWMRKNNFSILIVSFCIC
jgi:hypothetical protein